MQRGGMIRQYCFASSQIIIMCFDLINTMKSYTSMQVQKQHHSLLNDYFRDIQEQQVKGWQEESADITTIYPMKQKHPRIQKKALPFIRNRQTRDHKKLTDQKIKPAITSHLFCPARVTPANVTSIKFMGPKESQNIVLACHTNSKTSPSRVLRPSSRLLIQMPNEDNQLAAYKNFMLQGQRTHYHSKKSKRKSTPGSKQSETKECLPQQILSMTMPSLSDRMSKSLKRTNEQWFGASRQSALSKVGQQIKTKRCLSQKKTL